MQNLLTEAKDLIAETIHHSKLPNDYCYHLIREVDSFFKGGLRVSIPLISIRLMGIKSLTKRQEKNLILFTGVWAVWNVAADIFDRYQDRGLAFNRGIAMLGISRILLSQINHVALSELENELGDVMLFAAWSQEVEKTPALTLPIEMNSLKEKYFSNIVTKSATIIALGFIAPAFLLDASHEQRAALKKFGYRFGVFLQLGDDLLDLEEDIANNVLTLPVLHTIENLQNKDLIAFVERLNNNQYADIKDEIAKNVGQTQKTSYGVIQQGIEELDGHGFDTTFISAKIEAIQR